MGSVLQALSSVKGPQRVLLVALTLIPLVLVTLSTLPAFVVLPFVPGGIDRVRALTGQLIAWTRAILRGTA